MYKKVALYLQKHFKIFFRSLKFRSLCVRAKYGFVSKTLVVRVHTSLVKPQNRIVLLKKKYTLMRFGSFYCSLLFEVKFSYFCVNLNYFCKIQVNFVNSTLSNCQKMQEKLKKWPYCLVFCQKFCKSTKNNANFMKYTTNAQKQGNFFNFSPNFS